jgi:sec-independent protein translocase protein TatA
MPNLGGWEIVVLVGVLLLLFGAKRLPTMARSVGQSARIFKGEMKGLRGEPAAAPAPEREYTPTAVLPAVAEAPHTP